MLNYYIKNFVLATKIVYFTVKQIVLRLFRERNELQCRKNDKLKKTLVFCEKVLFFSRCFVSFVIFVNEVPLQCQDGMK